MLLDAQAFQYGLETRETNWNVFMCRGTEMTLTSCPAINSFTTPYYYNYPCEGDAGVQCLPISGEPKHYDSHK